MGQLALVGSPIAMVDGLGGAGFLVSAEEIEVGEEKLLSYSLSGTSKGSEGRIGEATMELALEFVFEFRIWERVERS